MLSVLLLPFINLYFLGNMLSYSTILIITGLGTFIAFRSGAFNLGGEGQIYLGSFAGIMTGLAFSSFPFLVSKTIIFFTSFVAGGIIALFSGYLKLKFKISEFISTFLVSEVAIISTNIILRGFAKDKSFGILASHPIKKALLFKKILPPSNLSTNIYISLLLVVFVWVLFTKTTLGYEMRIQGLSSEFSFYSGINVEKAIFLPLFLSGGFMGLSGIMDIMGRDGRFIQGFSYGYGWDGIIIALISRGNPIGIIIGAVLLSYIKILSQIGGIYGLFPKEIGDIAKAVIFLFLTISAFSYLGDEHV